MILMDAVATMVSTVAAGEGQRGTAEDDNRAGTRMTWEDAASCPSVPLAGDLGLHMNHVI